MKLKSSAFSITSLFFIFSSITFAQQLEVIVKVDKKANAVEFVQLIGNYYIKEATCNFKENTQMNSGSTFQCTFEHIGNLSFLFKNPKKTFLGEECHINYRSDGMRVGTYHCAELGFSSQLTPINCHTRRLEINFLPL